MAESRAFSTQVVDAGSLGLDPDRLGNLKSVIEEDTAKGVYDGGVFIDPVLNPIYNQPSPALLPLAGASSCCSGGVWWSPWSCSSCMRSMRCERMTMISRTVFGWPALSVYLRV